MSSANFDRMSSANIDKLVAGGTREAAHAWALLGAAAVYLLFAMAVFWLHGMEPPLSIDHVSYFKLIDEIRASYPNGDYWRTWNSVRAYAIICAYLYPLTGSHILTFKVLLAAMTVGYLLAFQLFMRFAGATMWTAVLFSILSAFFVSFGGSVWGMTDFTASLNRTIIIPFVVLGFWFFFSRGDSPWRYCIFPALIVLSELHLSALHVFLVFGVYEGLDFLLRRRLRPDRQLAAFAAAILVSLLLQVGIERLGIGNMSYITWNLAKAIPTAPASAPAAPPTLAGEVTPAAPGAVAGRPTTAAPSAEELAQLPPPTQEITPQEAWRIELFAFPWRNMPMSAATLATIALSFGVILSLAVWGALLCFRSGQATPLDRRMVMFAGATLIAAYGLQLSLWVARKFLPIYPINFEEIRAINMIMFPATYFAFRLYQRAPRLGPLAGRKMRIAIAIAFVLQPIYVLKALPAPWREGIINRAVSFGLIAREDSLRMQYAREILGLHGHGPRYYYSARSAIAWLEKNAGPDDKVMTNQNDFYSSRVQAVGVFLNVVTMDARSPDRLRWLTALQSVDKAFDSRDMDQIMQLARTLGATFVVVPWEVQDADYRDEYYSIVRVR